MNATSQPLLADVRPCSAFDEGLFLERLRAGDESARAALVRQYTGRLLAVARRLLRCEQDCADAVQDAFLSAFRSLDTFAGHSSLGTWLHRIVVNACLMRRRIQSRRREVALQVLPCKGEMGQQTESTRGPEEPAPALVIRAETRARVRALIDQLPEGHRTVLILRDIEERDTEETARHLGIAPGAVKTRLHRARQALRALLEPLFGEE
jgi:RNA polymerase sigma-70 factor (ECF subfamily)